MCIQVEFSHLIFANMHQMKFKIVPWYWILYFQFMWHFFLKISDREIHYEVFTIFVEFLVNEYIELILTHKLPGNIFFNMKFRCQMLALILSILWTWYRILWNIKMMDRMLLAWCFNPLRAKFFRGNINIYLYFVCHFSTLIRRR